MRNVKTFFIGIILFWSVDASAQYFSIVLPIVDDLSGFTSIETLDENTFYIPYGYNIPSIGSSSKLIETDGITWSEVGDYSNFVIGTSTIHKIEGQLYLLMERKDTSVDNITCLLVDQVNQNAENIFSYYTPHDFLVGANAALADEDLYILNSEDITADHRILKLLKINADGQFQWEKVYNLNKKLSYGWDFILANDGNYFMAAGVVYNDIFGRYSEIRKIDSSGNELMLIEGDERFLLGGNAVKIAELSNDHIVATYPVDKFGNIEFFNNGWDEEPARLIWYDENGIELNRSYLVASRNSRIYIQDMIAAKEDGFFVFGNHRDEFANDQIKAFILKLNNVGDTLWMKEYTHPEYPDSEFRTIDMLEMSNGDLVALVDIETAQPTLNGKPWLFRLSSTGCFQGQEVCDDIPSDLLEISSESVNADILVYPNPVKNQLIIKGKHQDRLSEIRLYSLEGRLLHMEGLTTTEFLLNMTPLTSGFYILEVFDERGRLFQKKVLKY